MVLNYYYYYQSANTIQIIVGSSKVGVSAYSHSPQFRLESAKISLPVFSLVRWYQSDKVEAGNEMIAVFNAQSQLMSRWDHQQRLPISIQV
jgi:hypothetical protein